MQNTVKSEESSFTFIPVFCTGRIIFQSCHSDPGAVNQCIHNIRNRDPVYGIRYRYHI